MKAKFQVLLVRELDRFLNMRNFGAQSKVYIEDHDGTIWLAKSIKRRGGGVVITNRVGDLDPADY